MAYPFGFSIALDSTETGLTLYAQLVDTDGANVGAAITTGFVEVGVGNYYLYTAAIPDDHRGGIEIYDDADNSLLAFGAINPEEGENVDAAIGAVPAAVWEFDGEPYEATAGTGTRAIELACAARGAVIGKLAVAGDVLTVYEVDGVTVMISRPLTPAGGPYTDRGA